MKVRALSDIHGHLPDLEPCDLVLISGDVCPIDDHQDHYQRNWLRNEFSDWITNLDAEVVWCAGNHEIVAEHPWFAQWAVENVAGHYLKDESVEFYGKKIHGTPWQPWFYDWAFNLRTEEELAEKWAMIPDDTDILLVHGPPLGFGDNPLRGGRCGSETLTERIVEVEPELVVCGHIHEDYGKWQLGPTTIANCSLVNARYKPVHPVMEFEL